MKESERQPEQNTIRSGKKRKKHLYTIYEEANKDRIAGEKPWTGTIHFDLDSTYSITGKTTGSILPDLQRITNRLSRTLNENTMAFSNPDNRRNSNEPEVGKGYFLYGIQGRVVVKVKKGDMLTISYPNQLNPNAEPTVEKMSVKDFKEKHAANNKKTEKKEGREKQYRVNYLNERWVISNKQDKPSKGVNLIQFSNDGSGHTFGFATFKELEKENVSLTDTLGKPLQDIVNEIALRGPQKKANATNVVPAGLKTKVEPTQIDTALSTQKKHLEPLSFQVDEIIEIFGDRYVVKEIASDNSRYLLVDQATRKEGWVERSSIDGLWSIAKENPIDIESILNDQAKAAVFQERGDNAFERGDIDGIIAVQTDIANKILELEKAGTEEYFINELYEVRGDLELKKNALIDRDISEEKEKRGDIGGIETDFSIGDRFENDGKIFVLKEIENYDDKDAILFVFNEEGTKNVWKLKLSQLEQFQSTMKRIEPEDPNKELQEEYTKLQTTLEQLKKGMEALEQSIAHDDKELKDVRAKIKEAKEKESGDKIILEKVVAYQQHMRDINPDSKHFAPEIEGENYIFKDERRDGSVAVHAVNKNTGEELGLLRIEYPIEKEKESGDYANIIRIVKFYLQHPNEEIDPQTKEALNVYPSFTEKVRQIEIKRREELANIKSNSTVTGLIKGELATVRLGDLIDSGEYAGNVNASITTKNGGLGGNKKVSDIIYWVNDKYDAMLSELQKDKVILEKEPAALEETKSLQEQREEELKRMSFDQLMEEFARNNHRLIPLRNELENSTFRVIGTDEDEKSVIIDYIKPDGTHGNFGIPIFGEGVFEKYQQKYKDVEWSDADINAKYDAELTQPENKVDDKKALDAKHTLYHREDFPEFQANTRTPETKKLLDYLAQVLEVPPYNGDIDSGTYVSWLNEHATAGTNDTPARQGLTNIKLSLNAPREVFDLIANYEAELAALEENKKTETIQPNTHEILNTGDTFEKGTTQAQLEEKEKVINLLRGINIKDEKKLRNILTTQIPNVYESTDVDTSRKLALALQQLANEYNFDIKDLT
jgi:hypothetical protein